MGDAEGIARDAVEKVALDGLARRESDGMHQAFEAVPVLAEFGEEGIDLRVLRDVAGEDQKKKKIIRVFGYRLE